VRVVRARGADLDLRTHGALRQFSLVVEGLEWWGALGVGDLVGVDVQLQVVSLVEEASAGLGQRVVVVTAGAEEPQGHFESFEHEGDVCLCAF
jgi:hypothetical protein